MEVLLPPLSVHSLKNKKICALSNVVKESNQLRTESSEIFRKDDCFAVISDWISTLVW